MLPSMGAETVIAGKPRASRGPRIVDDADALGVAMATGEVDGAAVDKAALLGDFGLCSTCASMSSGIKVLSNEVIVLGMSPAWAGPLRISHRPMRGALDIGSVRDGFTDLGLDRALQVRPEDRDRLRAIPVKCKPDQSGPIRDKPADGAELGCAYSPSDGKLSDQGHWLEDLVTDPAVELHWARLRESPLCLREHGPDRRRRRTGRWGHRVDVTDSSDAVTAIDRIWPVISWAGVAWMLDPAHGSPTRRARRSGPWQAPGGR